MHREKEGSLTVFIFCFPAGLEVNKNIRKIVHVRAVQHANFSLKPSQQL